MTTQTADLERLETILRELMEAVVVCDPNGRILLYNSSARRLFHHSEALSLGQSLYRLCTRPPVEHTLRMLRHRAATKNQPESEETGARFVCATVDGGMLLNCHVDRIASDFIQGCVFAFTFEDITRKISEQGRQGHLLEKMVQSLRRPLANLSAAAENLKTYPDMAPEARGEFQDIILKENEELTRLFASLAEESANITSRQWPLFDVNSADLIGCVARKSRENEGPAVIMTGVPLWLQADSHSLMLVLERFVQLVGEARGVVEVDIETLLGDRRVSIDIAWQGEPIPQAEVDRVLEGALPDSVGGMTIAEVLERHGSEVWSQKHRLPGYSLLRIPVPDSPRQWEGPAQRLPSRPEFYDFSLVEGGQELGEMAGLPLSALSYVVFDTETTGLRPSAGDEILSIAAVRIENGRLLSGERFEQLVRPHHPIPKSSLFFLDISEEMLRGEPQIEEVLPRFKAFVGDAILVAHNGAFDLNFIQSVAEKSGSGVRFTNPLLDTLLLSVVADEEETDFTLANIGERLGVEVLGSHTIMDDCYVTAQIFLKLLQLLEERGITTLGGAIAACERVAAAKRQ
ncbi:MAG: 3'-5' exonuclease [Desulfobulbaceae bacterium]